MASLDNIVKKTPTLGQVANLVKKKAVAFAPKKTGNLKRALDTYNRPSGMIKTTMKGNKSISLEVTLDVSPPGAEYGKFWNDPNVSSTVRSGKTPNVPRSINFAQKALEDPEVIRAINSIIDDVSNGITDYISSEAQKIS